MISRDALRYLRSVNQRKIAQYVCPFCESRAISSTSATSRKAIRTYRGSREGLSASRRSYASASSIQRLPLPETNPLPAQALPPDVGKLPLSNGNVRQYLKQWSQEYTEQQDRLGNQPLTQNRAVAPNSLFIRDVSALDEMKEDGINMGLENDDDFLSMHVDDLITMRRTLNPGDVFVVLAPEVSRQVAMHLGYVGQQHQLLLQNGKWMQGMVLDNYGEVISNFATKEEIKNIRKLLPRTVINAANSFDQQGVTALGDLPSGIATAFSTRFRSVQAEYDAFRRDYARAYDQIYQQVADATDYKALKLSTMTQQYMGFDLASAPGGARMALLDKFLGDSRFTISKVGSQHTVVVSPEHIISAGKRVAGWARDYQDAAARASAGKDVLPELRSNPLTQFIAKARRLVSKSRQIRSFDDCLEPSLTLPDCLPTGEQCIERKPTGETFTEHDKEIIKLIWDSCIRQPKMPRRAATVQTSTIALVLRAVGAYPDQKLDSRAATLFLRELGCMEPWSDMYNASVTAQIPLLGLNHDLKVVEQREEKAMKELDITDDSLESTLPDVMAALRKDWGDLEAFAVDPPTTRVVDDAFSVEPSSENPGHFWVHVHIAHAAALLPPHHEVLSRAEYMKSAYYGSDIGLLPYLPFEVLNKVTISDKRPSPVMTVSTLLHPDGSVVDVKVTAGTLWNVVKVDRGIFLETMNSVGRPEHDFFVEVGKKPVEELDLAERERKTREQADHRANQLRLIEQHRSKFELVDRLLRARFEARKKEIPNHLRSLREPSRDMRIVANVGRRGNFNTYGRLLSTEHCYGDPYIRLSRYASPNTVSSYADYPETWGSMYQMRSLAMESFGAWTRERQVPVLYSVVKPSPDFPIEKLNSLTNYDRYSFPISGMSLQPGPHVLLNARQTLNVTTPLRNFVDLVNQYQISAYLQAHANGDDTKHPRSVKVNYPYPEADLLRISHERFQTELPRLESNWIRHWTMQAFYRAWRDQETNFPKLFDARLPRNQSLFATRVSDRLPTGYLYPWPLKGFLDPTEQGYETAAKPTQFLPVRIVSIDPATYTMHLAAVGPASDVRSFPQNFVSELS